METSDARFLLKDQAEEEGSAVAVLISNHSSPAAAHVAPQLLCRLTRRCQKESEEIDDGMASGREALPGRRLCWWEPRCVGCPGTRCTHE